MMGRWTDIEENFYAIVLAVFLCSSLLALLGLVIASILINELWVVLGVIFGIIIVVVFSKIIVVQMAKRERKKEGDSNE